MNKESGLEKEEKRCGWRLTEEGVSIRGGLEPRGRCAVECREEGWRREMRRWTRGEWVKCK